MGNGAKAQARRERNANKNVKKTNTSQKKSNEAAKNIMCGVCRSTFLCTARDSVLAEHAQNKHGKTLQECFAGRG